MIDAWSTAHVAKGDMAKIPKDYFEEMLTRSAKGQTLATIQGWLKRKGVEVSLPAISMQLSKHRVERSESAKHLYRNYIEKKLPEDLAALSVIQQTNIRLLRRAQRDALKNPNVANYEKVSKIAVVVQRDEDARRKALGVDTPDSMVHDLATLLGIAFSIS